MNIRNILPESYQQRGYRNTNSIVNRQIQEAEIPPPVIVISVEAARGAYAILLAYLTTEVAVEEPEMGSTHHTILIDNNCTDDNLHFQMPGSSGDNKDEGDERNECDAIPTNHSQRLATTELEMFELQTRDVHRYEGEDGDDPDANEEEESSQANDESMQNVEDWGHSTRECVD